MFAADRIFSHKNHKSGKVQWFFLAREGTIGPYNSKEEAVRMLNKFKKICIELGETGGRGGGLVNLHTRFQLQNAIEYQLNAEIQWI